MDSMQTEELELVMFFEQTREKAAADYIRSPMDPDNLTRWGGALLELAQFRQGQDSIDIVQDAGSKLEEALRINPHKHDAEKFPLSRTDLIEMMKDGCQVYNRMIKDRFDPICSLRSTKDRSKTNLETEIPYRQVGDLFNVNHFIISQASPYMAFWLHFKESIQDRSSLAPKILHMMEMEVRHWCAQLLDMEIKLRMLTNLYVQKWEGDVNLILPITLSQDRMLKLNIFLEREHPFPPQMDKFKMPPRKMREMRPRARWAALRG